MIRHATAIGTIAFLLALHRTAMADDAQLEKLLAPDAKLEKLAGGMKFIEGAVWMNDDPREGGYLVFSDIPANELKKWDGKRLSTFRTNSHGANGNTCDNTSR